MLTTKERRNRRICSLLFFFIGQAGLAGAGQEAIPDKSRYNLFDPTPVRFMRELQTDRPDQTESPYTVDAGHFQIEMDFATATFDDDRANGMDLKSREWSVAPVNLKVGLLNNVDFQFVLDTYAHSRTKDRLSGVTEAASGFGDFTTRLKINLWGNDGGKTAFAMMPFVKWPLPSSGLRNGKTEGGIILPIGVTLPAGWDMTAMTEFDYNHDAAESGYHTEFINSVTFGHAIFGKLNGYAEFFSNVTTEGSSWIGTLDFGLTYGLTQNIQLDGGCNIGVTGAAEDFKAFSGISLRF